MNFKKKLIIVSNEKVSIFENKFYCDNIDMKSIPEGLSDNLEVLFIGRKSNIKRSHQIGVEKIAGYNQCEKEVSLSVDPPQELLWALDCTWKW